MALSMGLLGGAAYRNGDYELISTTILSSATSSVTFSNLASVAAGYKHLQIRAVDRSTASINSQMGIRFNGDSAANYSEHQMAGGGSGVGTYGGGSTSFAPMGGAPESGNTANVFGARIIDILDFNSTVKNKTIKELKGFSGSVNNIGLFSAGWYSTNAVTAIEVFMNGGSFVAGSRFSLYGLRG